MVSLGKATGKGLLFLESTHMAAAGTSTSVLDNSTNPKFRSLQTARAALLSGQDLPPNVEGANRELPVVMGVQQGITVNECPCRVCDEVFGMVGDLTRHLDAVHHTKRFRCPRCDFSANAILYVNEHVLAHLEEALHSFNYLVKECSRRFPSERTMRVHYEGTHEMKTWPCPFSK